MATTSRTGQQSASGASISNQVPRRPCRATPKTIRPVHARLSHKPYGTIHPVSYPRSPTQGSTKLPVARAPEARTVGVMAKPSPRAATPRLSRTERRPLHVSKRLLLSDNRSASKDLCEPTSKKGDRARWPVHLDTPLERSGRERDFAVNRRNRKGGDAGSHRRVVDLDAKIRHPPSVRTIRSVPRPVQSIGCATVVRIGTRSYVRRRDGTVLLTAIEAPGDDECDIIALLVRAEPMHFVEDCGDEIPRAQVT